MNARLSDVFRSPRARWLALLGAALSCTYDFDRFAGSGAGSGAGGIAGSAGGGGLGGRTNGGDGTSGAGRSTVAGEGGSNPELEAGSGGESAGGGEGGDGGEGIGEGGMGGSGGEPASGGTAGKTGSGGSTAAGTGGAGGSGGSGGSTGTGGKAGTAGSAGSGGSPGMAECTQLGGTVWRNHCYFTSGSTRLLWIDARGYCPNRRTRATLVTITSAEEQAMLEQNVLASTVNVWIGLSLAEVNEPPSSECATNPSSCPFQWVNGEPFSYANWSANQPRYDEACVRLEGIGFKWRTDTCNMDRTYQALCEYALP